MLEHCCHQSQKGREKIPVSGTNRKSGEKICAEERRRAPQDGVEGCWAATGGAVWGAPCV
eukprot:8278606-Pyramimonas_sp.AAC.1